VGSQSKSEEYNVYSAVLNNEYCNNKIKLFIIYEKTVDSINSSTGSEFVNLDSKFIKNGMPKIQDDILINFKNENKQKKVFEKQFNLCSNYYLLKESEYENIFKNDKNNDGWKKYRQMYPDSSGIINFSKIGFNNSKNQALVFFSTSFDYDGGIGSYYMLEKENNIWKINQKEMAFIM
jgi:hypothetical protein